METRTHTDPARLHVLAASLRLWLLDVLLWLSEWMGRALPRAWRISMRGDIRRALQGARIIVLMLALYRCGDAPTPVHTRHPHAPRGFRLGGFLNSDARGVCRTVRLRGRTIAARLAEVRDILDNLEIWIARVRRRLMALPHAARLVLCWLAAERMCALAAARVCAVDTS